jgi:signal peptidase I
MESVEQIRYVGSSMNPYLFQNDVLDYIPVSDRLPATGDVVVFQDPAGSGRFVIHRIVKTLPDGHYITKGDNAPYNDRYPISRSDIKGVVTGGVRGDRSFFISSGIMGILHHISAQQRRKLLTFMQRVFSGSYHLLSKQGFLCRFLPERFRQGIVIVKTSEGHDLQVYLGTHLAGWKGERDLEWTIIPPYRLFLNCAVLPDSHEDFFKEDWNGE